jgi:hypothetical protein
MSCRLVFNSFATCTGACESISSLTKGWPWRLIERRPLRTAHLTRLRSRRQDLFGLHENRMVAHPVSLAQLEFRRRNAASERKGSHAEFLRNELQNVDALNTYDRFFGCVRVPLSPLEYLEELQFILSVSDSYISDEAPYSSYRQLLALSIPELRSLAN